MNFSYNLNNLSQFHRGFINLMEYWLAIFPNDITIIESDEKKTCPELLSHFNQYLSEFSG